MKTEALTGYLLMGSHEPIIEWLDTEEDMNTERAMEMIEPIAMNIANNYPDIGSTLQTCQNIKKHYDGYKN